MRGLLGTMSDDVRLLIVGDGPVTAALRPMVDALGWTPTVTNDPTEAGAAVGSVDAVVVLSHHEDVDGPAIRDALAAGTPYVGAMGSRRTQARRRDWLLDNGVAEESLAGRIGTDVEPDRGPQPGERLLGDAVVQQPVAPPGLGPA